MRTPFRQFWQLRAIERGLRRSAPHTAAMLAIFARLTAGEAIASREQVLPPGSRLRRTLAILAGAIAGLAACLTAIGRRASLRVAAACAAARRQFHRTARVGLSASSAARESGDPGHTAEL